MIPKVLHLERLTREGWRLADMDFDPDGSVRVILARGRASVHFVFAHWEVPAMVTGSKHVPHAS